MRRALALEQSPALWVPLRFLLSAPIFVLLAALVLGWAGPGAFASRWSPYALATTHLLTLGALTSAMAGSLIQILPVVAGIHIARPVMTATVVHTSLAVGTLMLAGAFLSSAPILFGASAIALAIAFAWLLAALALGWWRDRKAAAAGSADLRHAVRLALVALLVTVSLGLCLVAALAWPHPLAVIVVTNWHATWGLGGWFGLLIVGASYQLIPMFQVTEPYPQPIARWFAPGAFAVLCLSALAASTHSVPDALARWLPWLLPVLYVVHGVVTLDLLRRRKRASPDVTTRFWLTSMASLIACPFALAAAATTHDPRWFVTFGILALVGTAWSAVNGMLYKIVPFLLWHHLQALSDERLPFLPKVGAIIPERRATPQFYAHLAALVLLTAASVWPAPLARVAAFALAVSATWLLALLGTAMRTYRQMVRRIAA